MNERQGLTLMLVAAVFVVGLLAFFVLALVKANVSRTAENPLAGTAWSLESASSDITLSFAAVEVEGWTGCNALMGEYTVESDRLTFVDLSWTERGCPTQEAFQREQAFQDGLIEVRRWNVSGSVLTLTTGDGKALAFREKRKE